MITMKKIYNYCKANDRAILNLLGVTYPWISQYQQKHTSMDVYFMKMYENLVFEETDDIDTFMDLFDVQVAALAEIGRYKYEKLFETLSLEYNPIWNVDGTTVTTDVYGEKKTTSSFGEQKGHMTHGEQKGTSSSTDSTAGYNLNDGTFNPSDKNESEFTNDTYTDDSRSEAYSDEFTDETYTDSHTEVRQGNIGVTSTQNLINQERDVANFKFYNILFHDVIKATSLNYYEED